MRPYGIQMREYASDREYGPPSKHWKQTSKNRTKCRRMLHKTARRQAKNELKNGSN